MLGIHLGEKKKTTVAFIQISKPLICVLPKVMA